MNILHTIGQNHTPEFLDHRELKSHRNAVQLFFFFYTLYTSYLI